MSSTVQHQLQTAVDSTLETLSVRTIRPLQKKSYLCAASCFDKHTSPSTLENCVQKCQLITQLTGQIVQAEIGEMQQRIQREMVSCEDKVRDAGITDQDKAQKMYAACGDGILKGWVKKVPEVGKRIESRIKSEASKL